MFWEIKIIKKDYGNNKYVYKGKKFAYYLLIVNDKYYIMYIENLQIGDKVKFEYLSKSRKIINICVDDNLYID